MRKWLLLEVSTVSLILRKMEKVQKSNDIRCIQGFNVIFAQHVSVHSSRLYLVCIWSILNDCTKCAQYMICLKLSQFWHNLNVEKSE